MPFDEITERITERPVSPCTIRLCRRKKGGLPLLVVSLKIPLFNQLRWEAGDKVLLGVGKDEHAGKLRLRVVDGQGTAPLRRMKFMAHMDFGHVESLGDVPRVRTEAAIEIEPGTGKARGALIITIPKEWPEDSRDKDEDETAEAPARPRAPVQAEPAAEPARRSFETAPPGKRTTDALTPEGGKPVEKDGIIVTLSPPQISRGNRTSACSSYLARILQVLLPGMPGIIDNAVLMRALYGSKPMQGADFVIKREIETGQPRLAKVNLRINTVKGIGFTLQNVE